MAMGAKWVFDTPLLGTAHTRDSSCDLDPDQPFLGDDNEDALVHLRERVPSMG